MDTQVLVLTLATLMTPTCLLMCHPTTWRTYPLLFTPGPQFCPDTGRTICTAVDYYPTERIYNLLSSTRSDVFNLTSLFVDERKGDAEPNFSKLLYQRPHYTNSNQQLPNGRLQQSARPPRGVWNNPNEPVEDRASESWSQHRQRRNQWRQVPNDYGSDQTIPESWGNTDGAGGRIQSTEDVKGEGYGSFERNRGLRTVPPIQNSFSVKNSLAQQMYNGPYRSHSFDGKREPDRIFREQRPTSDGFRSFQEKTYSSSRNDQPGYERSNGKQLHDRSLEHTHNVKDRGTALTDAYYSPNDEPKGGQLSKIGHGGRRGKRNQDEELACPVQSIYVPPRAALSDQSEWKFIVNIPERDQRFSQVVRVDVCITEGQPCSSRLSLPFGFQSRCRQKYIKKKLLSLDTDGQGTGEDNFFIPSCCVCEIVRSN